MSSSKTDTPAVTAEDQKKINRFARLHQKAEELKTDLKLKANELQNLSDAADELLMLDDDDSEPGIALRVGEVFVECATADEVTQRLDALKATLEAGVLTTRDRQTALEAEMVRLKVELYGKFGTSINLEAEEGD